MRYLTPFFAGYCLCVTALLGLVLGSFCNCMAWRLAHGESVARGRSHCAVCGHTLGATELIPLLSYLLQRGRCRHCGKKISPRYPAVELLLAVALVLLVLRHDFTVTALRFGLFTCVLLVLALVDLDTGELPDSLLLAGIANFLLFLPWGEHPLTALLTGVLSGLSVSLPLLLLSLLMDRLLKKDSMGGGDIKLFFVVGLYFDWKVNLLTLIFACLLGILFPFVSRIRTGEGESAFPFGPAIAAAALVSMLVGQPLIAWYLSLF
ncbi:MAG: prepilin peptidase [Oscillospiraceae bacterium]